MFTEYAVTKISRKNMNQIVENTLSSQKIVEFLEQGMTCQSFRNVLRSTCEVEDVEKEVVNRLEEEIGKTRHTISRNLKNWINGKFYPTRDDIYQICFAFHLNLEKSNLLLLSSTEMGIHYRNPKELIYIYGLEHKKSWTEICGIRDRILPLCQEKLESEKNKVEVHPDNAGTALSKYTDNIRNEYHRIVKTEDDLEEFLLTQIADMGVVHRSAHHDFLVMLDLLQNVGDGEKKMSVSDVVAEYIDMGVPTSSKKGQGNYSYMQKVIKRNWPSKDKIYKMRIGELDVTRKVMILLFLVTEEFVEGTHLRKQPSQHVKYQQTTDKYEKNLAKRGGWQDDEIFEIRVNYMNMYLDLYGMNLLDPRNPFDCLVLYALKASYKEDEDMDLRMREVLKQLF